MVNRAEFELAITKINRLERAKEILEELGFSPTGVVIVAVNLKLTELEAEIK
jgi:adenylate cyclase class IV